MCFIPLTDSNDSSNALVSVSYTHLSYSSREIVKIITKDGWYEVNCVGDHHQYKHPTKKGRLTIPHPKKDLPIGTVRSIFKQAGIKIL